ncbi:MAG TPA: SMP-30/gluconolactonase/LRE family protein [Gemmatimonadales bacterium]|nr:SMP-30/gluconolactonase/LRE family protein [Gemmatimonadales bacterium]
MSRSRLFPILALAGACLLPRPALAHPGSGIVVDRLGQVYFVDMVSGIWKLEAHGALSHLPGPAFHWMTLDATGRFAGVALPSGPGWEFALIGSNPTLLLASDFPLALGRDGKLYFPSQGGTPLQLRSFSPSGQAGVLATLPVTTSGGPLRWLNGLAAAPDGSFYYSEDDAIRRVGSDGRVATVAERVSPKGCAPHNPLLRGLDVDAGGNIYVADTGCGNVLKLTPAGVVTILPQVPRPWFATGVALSGKDLYVLEFENPDTDDRHAMLPRIRKIAPDGTTSVVATVTRH